MLQFLFFAIAIQLWVPSELELYLFFYSHTKYLLHQLKILDKYVIVITDRVWCNQKRKLKQGHKLWGPLDQKEDQFGHFGAYNFISDLQSTKKNCPQQTNMSKVSYIVDCNKQWCIYFYLKMLS